MGESLERGHVAAARPWVQGFWVFRVFGWFLGVVRVLVVFRVVFRALGVCGWFLGF